MYQLPEGPGGCMKYWTGLRQARAVKEDLERLEELAWTTECPTLCALGKTAANPF